MLKIFFNHARAKHAYNMKRKMGRQKSMTTVVKAKEEKNINYTK
jgi:hypothetical protein